MSNTDRRWIGITLDGGEVFPVIKVNGESRLKRRIEDVQGVKEIGIHLIDFQKKCVTKIGNIHWPVEVGQGDLMISFNPKENVGDIQIEGTSYVWSYDIKDVGKKQEKKKDMIDKEAVLKEMEKKEKVIIYAEDIMKKLNEHIYGQEEATRITSEIIASTFNKKNPELITMLFMGPTGVGKTEVAKILQLVMTELTGEEWGLQNISMNEFKEAHSISRLFGTSAGYVGFEKKTLFDPSRGGKPQIYVLNEFDKTHLEVVDGLMEVFSEGVVQLGDNTQIDLRGKTIIIMTTNLPINMEEYNKATPFMKKEMCRNIIARHCGRPEMAGKITNALAFQELPDAARLDIIEKFVEEKMSDFDIEVDRIEKPLATEFLQIMKATEYGARAIKDAVGTALIPYTAYRGKMDNFVGKRVVLCGTVDQIRLELCA